MGTAETALLAAVAVHLGFQLTVSALVYPALFRAPDWGRAHMAHSRSITPLVALVYGGLAGSCAWVVVEGVDGPGTVVALTGVALSLATTALVAAPIHGRLARERDPALLRALRIADLVRTGGAAIALIGAVLTAV